MWRFRRQFSAACRSLMPRTRAALDGITTTGGGMDGSGEHEEFPVAVGQSAVV